MFNATTVFSDAQRSIFFFLSIPYLLIHVQKFAGKLAAVLLLSVISSQAVLASYPEGTFEVHYVHTDIHRNVVAVTDENRNVIERYEYEPYGLPQEPFTQDQPGYTGHVHDADTGLIYMQQRYYDPEVGRFLSVDPVKVDTEAGSNFNRYWYANNNPYKYIDPDGREVAIGWHEVAFGKSHAFIRIKPENQEKWKNDKRFQDRADPSDGKAYVTLGAGPDFSGSLTNPKLVSEINRATDADASTHSEENYQTLSVPSEYTSEDQWIEKMFDADSAYDDSADYPLDGVPGDSDSTYNSNSYVSGILEATGSETPDLPVDTPGIEKPLPKDKFED